MASGSACLFSGRLKEIFSRAVESERQLFGNPDRTHGIGDREMRKKEEFLGIMENMLSRNSFPQICVVSVNQFLRIAEIRQEYEGSAARYVKTC
jgi:hypothetical protein